MRYFLIFLLLIPSLAFAEVKTGAGDPGAITGKPVVKVGGAVDKSAAPGEGSMLNAGKQQDKQYVDILLKTYNLAICQSKKAISDPNSNLIPCTFARIVKADTNLFYFYTKGWKLISILKTDNGYLYYLDKK